MRLFSEKISSYFYEYDVNYIIIDLLYSSIDELILYSNLSPIQPNLQYQKLFLNFTFSFLFFRNNTIACAKHFVGDGGTHKGLNEGNTISSYDDLERIHMAPYLDCISQGVSTVMASFSSWNGSKLHADRFLLTEVLKDKLGFKVKTR